MAQERPAAKAVRLLGLKEVAYACGLTTDAVRKWPGHIPAEHQPKVYDLAIRKGVVLTAHEIIGVIAV